MTFIVDQANAIAIDCKLFRNNKNERFLKNEGVAVHGFDQTRMENNDALYLPSDNGRTGRVLS